MIMLWVWFYDMSICKMNIYVHEHEHWNGNGDTTPIVIEMCFHYRRKWPVLNENGVTTRVVIEIRSHYPRDGPMHNEMMLYKLFVWMIWRRWWCLCISMDDMKKMMFRKHAWHMTLQWWDWFYVSFYTRCIHMPMCRRCNCT